MNKKVIIGLIVVIVIAFIAGGIYMITKDSKEDSNKDGNKKTSAMKDKNELNTTSKEKNTVNKNKTEENEESKNEEEKSMYSTGKHHAKIDVEYYGTIEVELDADVAPITVANFAKLVNEGFYDGLTFHRIIDGFMIQGGDPLGNGTGGSDEKIKGEFSSNGIKNDISHVRGTISMARSKMPNSASSQFFIVHEDSTFLDGEYAGFGKVTKGMEIVDEIAEETQVEDSNGTVLSENQPTIEKITMID